VPFDPDYKEKTIAMLKASQVKKSARRYAPVALAACVAVILLGAGVLWLGRDTTPPPVAPDGGVTVNTTTVTTTVLTTTTTAPNGTGGDEGSCTIHDLFYHSIDVRLIRYIGDEKMDEFIESYSGKGEICNIVTFVEFCNISREEFIQVMGWEDVLDQPATEHDDNPPYTYGEFVEAIYGDDAALSERVFVRKSIY
jgi:hypothetical protein